MIAISLLAVLSIGGLAANSLASEAITINQMHSQANFLAREAMEAVQSVRAENFSSIHPGEYHPVLTPSGWNLSPGEEILENFSRKITISNVMREISCASAVCDIVQAGGVVDEGTLGVRVVVVWKEAGVTKNYQLSGLVTYWR